MRCRQRALQIIAQPHAISLALEPLAAGTEGYNNRRRAVLNRWCGKAALLLESAGLLGGKAKTVTIHMLLNRLLGMRVEMQGQLFGYFSAILDKVGCIKLR